MVKLIAMDFKNKVLTLDLKLDYYDKELLDKGGEIVNIHFLKKYSYELRHALDK